MIRQSWTRFIGPRSLMPLLENDAKRLKRQIEDLVTYLSENPEAGDEMVGTGGCRVLRLAVRGKGKSGGFRTVTFFSGDSMPVYLITVFSKGERSNLTALECRGLKTEGDQ